MSAGCAHLTSSPTVHVAVGAIDGTAYGLSPMQRMLALILIGCYSDPFSFRPSGFRGSVHDAHVLKNSPVYAHQRENAFWVMVVTPV